MCKVNLGFSLGGNLSRDLPHRSGILYGAKLSRVKVSSLRNGVFLVIFDHFFELLNASCASTATLPDLATPTRE